MSGSMSRAWGEMHTLTRSCVLYPIVEISALKCSLTVCANMSLEHRLLHVNGLNQDEVNRRATVGYCGLVLAKWAFEQQV